MKEHFTLSETFNATPEKLYAAWLNSESHSEMTGGEAKCSNMEGDSFSAWDGYITGTNIAFEKNEKITQSWRTSEFAEDDSDSTIIVSFTEVKNGTEVTIEHSNIPEGQTQYEKGWIDHYFTPMKAYFQ